MDRKWVPTIADLIDRLSIHQLKEVFVPDRKEKYAKEMKDIMHDINLLIQESEIDITADIIRAIIVLAQMNTHIWYNEQEARSGENQSLEKLKLSHGLNGLRNKTMNYILDLVGSSDRRDWKVDCLGSEFKDWQISLGGLSAD